MVEWLSSWHINNQSVHHPIDQNCPHACHLWRGRGRCFKFTPSDDIIIRTQRRAEFSFNRHMCIYCLIIIRVHLPCLIVQFITTCLQDNVWHLVVLLRFGRASDKDLLSIACHGDGSSNPLIPYLVNMYWTGLLRLTDCHWVALKSQIVFFPQFQLWQLLHNKHSWCSGRVSLHLL